ncbi:MAG: group II truncated hemoglobin [Acidimicrobiia bacterium]|nr:group II truncated hemoglobin [Acidimicrobiia bacterium]
MSESPISEPSTSKPWGSTETPYEEIGGDPVVRAIAEAFYDIIERESPVLRAMLPASTSGSRMKLYQFLSGWTGGPPLYWEEHGHPRLRLRHAPFPIDDGAAEEWARVMALAIDSVEMPERAAGFLKQQLSAAALTLINR